tara:strand:+ start:1911 stop:2201 length:291 start_codon:yes stop_codon:yes gene_type:complete
MILKQINKENIFKKIGTISETDLDEEKIILNTDSGKFISINKTGSEIYEEIDGIKSVNDIILRLGEKYENSQELNEDILSFINLLFEKRLIELIDK